MLFKILFLFITAIILQAKTIGFNELKRAPNGLAKDYYIYRFITEQNASKKQISFLSDEIYRYKGVIKKAVEKKISKEFAPNCPPLNANDITGSTTECINLLLNTSFLTKLDSSLRFKLAEEIRPRSQILSNFIMGFNSPNPAKYYADILDTQSYMRYYDMAIDKEGFLASYINSDFFAKLTQNPKFRYIINEAVITQKNTIWREKLLSINSPNLHPDSSFMLGINAILFKRNSDALRFFTLAAKKYKYASKKDNANFWVYLLTKDKSILHKIANSSDINMYSLYAKELIGQTKIKIARPNPVASRLNGYDHTDPFAWQKVLNHIASLTPPELVKFATKFYTKETIGEYIYIMQKAHNHKIHFYPTAFMKYIGSDDPSRQALILAIARQESRFVPGSVSTSYALGMMQFMPFLANHIGNDELKIKNFDQDEMFKPEVAYRFANYHIDYLEKFLQHPLFIAYAYNGGIGFTQRMLKGGILFSKNSPYMEFEPFLSMELVPYAQSRDYGKKVLANYVVYLAILHSNAKISQLFENLMKP